MSDIVFTVFNVELSLFEPYLELSSNSYRKKKHSAFLVGAAGLFKLILGRRGAEFGNVDLF